MSSGSTATRATLLSESAATSAWAQTWREWRCGWPSRNC
jgi:hypothetical protein